MRTLLSVISILCAWTTGAPTRAEAQNAGAHTPNPLEQASQTWQILDYLADDYRGAVADGRIVSASEYAEMREFAAAIRTQLNALPTAATSAALREASDQLPRSPATTESPYAHPTQSHV